MIPEAYSLFDYDEEFLKYVVVVRISPAREIPKGEGLETKLGNAAAISSNLADPRQLMTSPSG